MTALLLALAAGAFAAPAWLESLPEALAASKASGRPVLVDFEAPWCYSCYYMRKHVLDRPAFARLSERLVLLKTDVDSEGGAALKKKYAVTFLPTYVLLDGGGRALGRVVGEQTEADFVAAVEALLGASAGAPEAAAVASLKARLDAGELERARRWEAALPKGLKKALGARRDWRILSARLSLRLGRDAETSFAALLKEENSCALAYDVFEAQKRLPASSLAAARAPLERLVETRVFSGDRPCADARSPVEALAEAYGDGTPAATDLFKRAAGVLEARRVKPGEDRNHDDNLRHFLQRAGEDARLMAFYPRLVKAYPADYVYAHRFARYLLEKGEPAAALPWAESAARLAYGANRLAVTEVQAKALAALGRKDEARRLLKRDIKAGRAFPAAREKLKTVLAGL